MLHMLLTQSWACCVVGTCCGLINVLGITSQEGLKMQLRVVQLRVVLSWCHMWEAVTSVFDNLMPQVGHWGWWFKILHSYNMHSTTWQLYSLSETLKYMRACRPTYTLASHLKSIVEIGDWIMEIESWRLIKFHCNSMGLHGSSSQGDNSSRSTGLLSHHDHTSIFKHEASYMRVARMSWGLLFNINITPSSNICETTVAWTLSSCEFGQFNCNVQDKMSDR